MVYVGVDWASGRWLVVTLGDEVTITTEPSLLNVWHEYEDDAKAILIDIPIGLPEVGSRACDQAAREFVGSRSGSVFSIPCRRAVKADGYDDACKEFDGSLGCQSWWLFPQINEVDALLQREDTARNVIYESHPEVCFKAFNGGSMDSKTEERGLKDRMEVLKAVDKRLGDRVEKEVIEREGGTDWHDRLSSGRRNDIVDAAVLAATGKSVSLGTRREGQEYPSLPDEHSIGLDEPQEDPELDLPMEIVFPGRDADIES